MFYKKTFHFRGLPRRVLAKGRWYAKFVNSGDKKYTRQANVNSSLSLIKDFVQNN